MWHLKSIRAKNLCSFLEMDYSPKQGEATLIFGNNLDNDSQNSNGSGKSALIEAIAIALTGEPLRKVNVDEIINDTQDEAAIYAILSNDALESQLTINRKLSRKQPQAIQVLLQTGSYDTDVEEIVQATVADYNKYILDQLGLSKDDIFANFILTARKYKSFLASSDKEKKEIINRFSNGVLVDQSIEALQSDMVPVQEELNGAEKQVATCIGRVDAMATEIEKAINESEECRLNNESRIKNWEDLIASKRADIRLAKDNITGIEVSLDGLDVLDEDMQKIEKSDVDALEALTTIEERFKSNNLALTTDYRREMTVLQTQVQSAKENVSTLNQSISALRKALETAENDYSITSKDLQSQKADTAHQIEQCDKRLNDLTVEVKELQHAENELETKQKSKKREIANIENQLAGVIVCPKCKHEFVLNAQIDIQETRQTLKSLQKILSQIDKDIESNETEYNKVVAEGKEQRLLEAELNQKQRAIEQDIEDAEKKIQAVRRDFQQCERDIEDANCHLTEIQNKVARIRKRIFDEVFEIIDEAYKRREGQIKSLETEIETLKGSIASYEKAIKDAKEVSEEDILQSLKKSQEEYRQELQCAEDKKNEVEGRLNELKSQEQTFIEFKTYLANTKINAIAQITNEFLETIGSDIRVALSGYTILKSGKVRDKISISLLRDGVDCGSFEKFSAGERVRVELASILSMNQLTNMNCEDGKGLDLLIADEVLDSADEQGLASVFKALNKTQLTSLVVSHGLTNEGYPNKITIVKQNGVSSIYANQDTN